MSAKLNRLESGRTAAAGSGEICIKRLESKCRTTEGANAALRQQLSSLLSVVNEAICSFHHVLSFGSNNS
jgi:hypothetical protein